MAKLLRKALGLFVELPDETDTGVNTNTQVNFDNKNTNSQPPKFQFKNEDLEKFEAHFEQLMDAANLPGPDYYEFCKMMEALEKAVPDERARIAAVFASLSVQGLTKDKLLNTASKYLDIIDADHDNFNNALSNKSSSDIDQKKQRATDLEKKINDNSQLIQKLTREITECQEEIGKLSREISEGESKLETNRKGYEVAYGAMISKIKSDIRTIQNSI
jgi:chromosome segregation ATPase